MKTKQTEDKGKCRCGGCGLSFGSLFAFDKHRIGPYTDRRCLTSAEMVNAGFKVDKYGRWRGRGGKPQSHWRNADALRP